MEPLIPAMTAKKDRTLKGITKTRTPTKRVPTIFAIAAAPIQHAEQQALCLESKKNASIANPGAK